MTEPLQPKRRWIRRVADRVDGLLHPLRRKRAHRQIAGLSPTPGILFVCHGNVCRSPYAAYAFSRVLRLPDEPGDLILSGGFVGPGRGSPSEALEAARKRGIDLTEHRSGPLDLAAVQASDLVIVMEPRQRGEFRELHGPGPWRVVLLGDLDPDRIPWRRIRDPWGREPEVFDEVFERIDRCLEGLATALGLPTKSERDVSGPVGS